MKKRSDPFPHDATVLDEPVRANGEDAPPDSAAAASSPEVQESPPPPEPRMEAPAASESTASPVPPPAQLDLPIASVLPPMAPLLHTPADAAPLEARIQRLEAELAQLRTAPPRDPRVAGFQTAPSAPAAPVPRQPERFWANLGKRLVAPSGPSASSPRSEGLASMVPSGVRRTWMLWDALTELRAMYWMFIDPRYRLSWTARLAPVLVLAMILTSGFWLLPLSGIPYVGFVIDKIADLALAYLLFKLLSYEARRYRETAPDLPPSLRL